MSQPITETPTDRPPTNADVTPQASSLFGRIGFTTTALRAYTMLFALVAIWIYFNYSTGGVFLNARNLSTLMVQTAVTGVLATGMLMVIVAGQIDLSVGSVVGLTGMIAAAAMTWQGYGLVPAIAATIIAGIVIGLVQGALVAYANIPAFIVTLGGLLAWRGVVKGLSEGTTVPVALAGFKSIGNDFLDPRLGIALAVLAVALIIFFGVRRALAARGEGVANQSTARTVARILIPSVLIAVFVFVLNRYQGIPVPVVVLLAVAIAGAFLTSRTTFGRYLYAIGGNPDAARLSGINLRGHILAVFALMGALSGVAAIVYTARLASASPDAGTLLELDAIAACVIGGASLMGGRGTIFGAILGALFMASLDNGMSLNNTADWKQDVIKGLILVGAVGLDMVGRRRN